MKYKSKGDLWERVVTEGCSRFGLTTIRRAKTGFLGFRQGERIEKRMAEGDVAMTAFRRRRGKTRFRSS